MHFIQVELGYAEKSTFTESTASDTVAYVNILMLLYIYNAIYSVKFTSYFMFFIYSFHNLVGFYNGRLIVDMISKHLDKMQST